MTDSIKRKISNTKLENLALFGNKKQKRARMRDLIEELGSRQITLSDLANPESPKNRGIIEALHITECTLDELLILQQYAKAVDPELRDTRAAEFIRDTSGQRPKDQIDLTNINKGGLSELSTEDLIALRDNLELLAKKEKES